MKDLDELALDALAEMARGNKRAALKLAHDAGFFHTTKQTPALFIGNDELQKAYQLGHEEEQSLFHAFGS